MDKAERKRFFAFAGKLTLIVAFIGIPLAAWSGVGEQTEKTVREAKERYTCAQEDLQHPSWIDGKFCCEDAKGAVYLVPAPY